MIIVRYNMVAIIKTTNFILPAEILGQSGIFYAEVDELRILLSHIVRTERTSSW